MPCPFLLMNDISDCRDLLSSLQERYNPAEGESNTENFVKTILERVRTEGMKAVVEYTRQYDCPTFTSSQFAVPEELLATAAASLGLDDASIIQEAANNIREFHEKQKGQSWFITRDDGSIFGQRQIAVDSAGLYIPGGKGGTTPLISSLLMNVIPAQVAGVKRIAIVTPPTKEGSISPFLMAAAHLLGVKEVYAAGGAWAVAALAHGAGPLRPVDVITGPGNIYVTTAKRLLIGTVGIDMIAGPSEIFIIADKTANAAWVAADMLSQAEHDPLASALCVTTDKGLAEKIMKELALQLPALPRASIATTSLCDYGAVVYTPKMEIAYALANAIAPEHLELLVADPWAVLPKIRHAGAIFMGHSSSEAFGDYYAGPNHVLPTMSTARFASALSVDVFMKKTSIVATSPAFAKASAESVARLARIEGLEGHARSALSRLR